MTKSELVYVKRNKKLVLVDKQVVRYNKRKSKERFIQAAKDQIELAIRSMADSLCNAPESPTIEK